MDQRGVNAYVFFTIDFVKALIDKMLAVSGPLLPESEGVDIGTTGKLITFNHPLISIFKFAFLQDHGLVANRKSQTLIITVIQMSTDLFLLVPSPQVLDMEIIEVGYALTVRTVDKRYASEGEKVYDIEVLKVSANDIKRNMAKPTH